MSWTLFCCAVAYFHFALGSFPAGHTLYDDVSDSPTFNFAALADNTLWFHIPTQAILAGFTSVMGIVELGEHNKAWVGLITMGTAVIGCFLGTFYHYVQIRIREHI